MRSNAAYFSFPAYVCCDTGQASLRIEVPEGFTVETTGSPLSRSSDDGVTTYTAEGVDPEAFFVVALGRNDDALDRAEIEVSGVTVTVAAWPDDPNWQAFALAGARQGIPAMERLTGVPIGIDELELVEANSPYLYGYAGWYIAATDVIEVGDELDQEVLLHELSHIWFNRGLFSERWLNEGFAQTFAAAALAEEGEEVDDPRRPVRRARGAIELRDWGNPVGIDEDDIRRAEEYGYNASWFVVEALADEVGLDGLASAIQAIDGDELSYLADDGRDPEQYRGRVSDWRRLLDLLEQRAGATGAEELLRAYVLSDTDIARLDTRAVALARVAELERVSDDWEIPVGIREELTDWDFRHIEELVEGSERVLDLRDSLTVRAASLDVVPPAEPELAYEVAEDLDDLDAVADALRAQAADLAVVESALAAIERDQDVWTRWGLRGEDLDAEYADVTAAFEAGRPDELRAEAAQIDQLLTDAAVDAKRFWTRVAIAVGVALAVLAASAFVLIRRRRRRRSPAHAVGPTDAITEVTAETEAGADTADGVEPAAGDAADPTVTSGLRGTDSV